MGQQGTRRPIGCLSLGCGAMVKSCQPPQHSQHCWASNPSNAHSLSSRFSNNGLRHGSRVLDHARADLSNGLHVVARSGRHHGLGGCVVQLHGFLWQRSNSEAETDAWLHMAGNLVAVVLAGMDWSSAPSRVTASAAGRPQTSARRSRSRIWDRRRADDSDGLAPSGACRRTFLAHRARAVAACCPRTWPAGPTPAVGSTSGTSRSRA